MSVKPGEKLGPWTLLEVIESGGNAEVWMASQGDDTTCALKVLKSRRPGSEPRRRFEREVEVQRRLTDERFDGTLPLLGASEPTDRVAWLAMPVAKKITDALGGEPGTETVIEATADIAAVLAALHGRGIAHRDVKPENLFRYGGRWCVGDLGLIHLPDAEPITTDAKAVGPRHYIAPEMLSSPTSDGRPADVYSLAKTLWVLLTRQNYPMPGPHRVDEPAVLLRQWVHHPRAAELDRLLERATVFAAADRPTMTEFEQELRTCLHPPPVVSAVPNLDDLADRINAMTDPGRLAEERRLRTIHEVNTIFERLREKVVSDAYHAFGRRLTGFKSILNTSDFALRELPLDPSTTYEIGWGGRLFTSGVEPSVEINVAIGVRAHANGSITIVGLLTVSRTHPGIADRHDIWRHTQTVPIGSAQQDIAIGNMINLSNESLERALIKVAQLLA
jgi:serine/threonine protein kinase